MDVLLIVLVVVGLVALLLALRQGYSGRRSDSDVIFQPGDGVIHHQPDPGHHHHHQHDGGHHGHHDGGGGHHGGHDAGGFGGFDGGGSHGHH